VISGQWLVVSKNAAPPLQGTPRLPTNH